MDAEAIEAATRFVTALRELIDALGSGYTACIVIVLTVGFVGVPAWREYRRGQRVDLVIIHKEQEVERLAEDNRRYREVYLSRLGVPSELLAADRIDSERAARERKE